MNLPKKELEALASAESIEMTSIDVTDSDTKNATTNATTNATNNATNNAPAKKTKGRRKTTSRLMHFVKAETAHVGSLTRFSPKTLSRMSGLIVSVLVVFELLSR